MSDTQIICMLVSWLILGSLVKQVIFLIVISIFLADETDYTYYE